MPGVKINFRPHGHATERAGADAVAPVRMTQAMRLLLTYVDADKGRTDDEAAALCGMETSNSYTKRCSDLRNLNYIASKTVAGIELTRPGSAGVRRIICWITDEGRAWLDSKRA